MEFGELFGKMPAWIGGLIMATTMATLRVVYDKEETSAVRILLESVICGALTLTAGSAVEAMGYGSNWYLFVGGTIGFMGSQSIRAIAHKLVNKHI